MEIISSEGLSFSEFYILKRVLTMYQPPSAETELLSVYKVFLYCSCQFTKTGFMSLFENSPVIIDIIPVDSPCDITQQDYKPEASLLVIFGCDDSLDLSARAAWFAWRFKQNNLINKMMCVHMYSERGLSYCNGLFDFPLYGSVVQLKKHIIMLLMSPKNSEEARTHTIKLTPREKELASCLSEGLSVRDISTKMGVSKKTILVVRMGIVKKIGVKNRNYIHKLKFLY